MLPMPLFMGTLVTQARPPFACCRTRVALPALLAVVVGGRTRTWMKYTRTPASSVYGGQAPGMPSAGKSRSLSETL